jgi:hypothetical protein
MFVRLARDVCKPQQSVIVLIVWSLLFCTFIRGGSYSHKNLLSMEVPPPLERRQMESRQGDEHVLHILISNQSMTMTVAEIEVIINGQQIFHREMVTGTQHNWSELTIPVRGGEHIIVLTEAKTQTRTSETINADRELWIIVRFSSPPAEFKIDVFNHPVAFM